MALRNTCPFTTRLVGRAVRLYLATTPIDLFPYGPLSSLGLQEGAYDPDNNSPFLEWDIVPARVGAVAFFRIAVAPGNGADYGAPTLFLRDAGSNNVKVVSLSQESPVIAPGFAFFSAATAVPGNVALGVIGTQGAAPGTVIAAPQFHISGEDCFTLERPSPQTSAIEAPLASTGDLLYGRHLFLREGRRTPLYAVNVLRNRVEGRGVSLSVETSTETDCNITEGSDTLLLDPSEMGNIATISLASKGVHAHESNYRLARRVTVHKTPAHSVKTVRVLGIGDSLSNFWWTSLRAILASHGVTYEGVGTINNGTREAPLMGEGRGAHMAAHFTGQADGFGRVPLGQEAAYLAKSDEAGVAGNEYRMGFMPMLRPAAASDHPGSVFGGWTFDPGTYVERFRLTRPDIVTINLGQNDIWSPMRSDWERLRIAFHVLYRQTRASFPDAKIIFASNSNPRSALGDTFWPPSGFAGYGYGSRPEYIFRELLRLEEQNRNDANLYIASAWAHMSPSAGWPETVASRDPATGIELHRVSDAVHPTPDQGAARQYARVLADAISAVTA